MAHVALELTHVEPVDQRSATRTRHAKWTEFGYLRASATTHSSQTQARRANNLITPGSLPVSFVISSGGETCRCKVLSRPDAPRLTALLREYHRTSRLYTERVCDTHHFTLYERDLAGARSAILSCDGISGKKHGGCMGVGLTAVCEYISVIFSVCCRPTCRRGDRG